MQSVRVHMQGLGTRKLYKILYKSLRELHVGWDKLLRILNVNHQFIKLMQSCQTTSGSHYHFRKHKNLVEKMDINRSKQVWISYIAYIGNRGNHHYLFLITDAYSKK